jgi:hypothetical protein
LEKDSNKDQPEATGGSQTVWDEDDFFLDSIGIEAPRSEVFELLAETGMAPESVAHNLRKQYSKYLERIEARRRRGEILRSTCRGSRKHMLDWVESPTFLAELAELLKPVDVVIPASAPYFPKGYEAPMEARLDRVGHELSVVESIRSELRTWWLRHHNRANTPNWDLALECRIEGVPGLVLVEAKANRPELNCGGKPRGRSRTSQEYQDQICRAIAEACAGLTAYDPGVQISVDTHYQLANRAALLWKLAQLGVPTVLVYLGFTGDDGIRDVGEPFTDHQDWCNAFAAYADAIVPRTIRERRLDLGAAPAWWLVRSRPVIGQSPSRRGARGNSTGH